MTLILTQQQREVTMDNKIVYFHINPLTNKVFYIGIGKPNRAYYKGKKRSQFWHNEVKKYGYIIDIIHENLTVKEAIKLEIFYINKIGRRDLGKGTLVNLTDGGEGNFNRVVTEETKKKISLSNTGKIHSEETKQKLSLLKKGKKQSEEHKTNVSLSKMGHQHSEETKKKISLSNTGKPNHRKGTVTSKETKAKISAAKKGKKRSEETIRKISETKKLNRELKKQNNENNLSGNCE